MNIEQLTKILLVPQNACSFSLLLPIKFSLLSSFHLFRFAQRMSTKYDLTLGNDFCLSHLSYLSLQKFPSYCESMDVFILVLYRFCMLVHVFYSTLLPCSYRSSNYCDNNSYSSFSLFMAIAKSSRKRFAIVSKIEKERQLLLLR